MTDLEHFLTADRIVGGLLLLWAFVVVGLALKLFWGFWRDAEAESVKKRQTTDRVLSASTPKAPGYPSRKVAGR